jgi:hypothetical protein
MELPAFLFQLLEHELLGIQEKLLIKVADTFGLDIEVLKRECLAPLTLVPNQGGGGEKVKITRVKNPRGVPEEEDRCLARIWNRGMGGQCSRKKCGKESNLCRQHQVDLRHGYYERPPPMNVFSGVHRSVYK